MNDAAYPVNPKIIGAYSNAVGKYGPDCAAAIWLRTEYADNAALLAYFNAIDSLKLKLGGSGMDRESCPAAFVEFNKGSRNEPRITIETVYDADGWTTTIVMPDGAKYRRSMKRVGDSGGMFKGTRKGDFCEDGVPEAIADVIDRAGDHMDVVKFLNT